MKQDIERVIGEIDQFRNWFNRPGIQGHTVSQLDEDVFTIAPRGHVDADDRDIDLTFMALTHGDEIGGLQVLNELLRLFSMGWNLGTLKIAFILANAPAAAKGLRFIEKDLNREFGNDTQDTLESRRARALEQIFLRTKLLIDYHQTESFTPSPFYISRFDAESFLKFRRAMPNTPAVTYFGKNLTPTSLTTVNYHLINGGQGFGIEMGQQGFSDYQAEFGVSLAIKMIHALTQKLQESSLNNADFKNTYTFSSTVVTKTGAWIPSDKIGNLVPLKPYELIGSLDGSDLFVKTEERIIFLKCPAGGRLAPGAEAFRFIRSVSEVEIAERLRESKGATL